MTRFPLPKRDSTPLRPSSLAKEIFICLCEFPLFSPSNLVIIFYMELFRIENLAMRPSIYERRFFDVFREEIWNSLLKSRAEVWPNNGCSAFLWLASKCQLGSVSVAPLVPGSGSIPAFWAIGGPLEIPCNYSVGPEAVWAPPLGCPRRRSAFW